MPVGGGPRAGHEPRRRDFGPGREVPLDAGLDPKSLGPGGLRIVLAGARWADSDLALLPGFDAAWISPEKNSES
jgi:hypothetical protein